MTPHHLGFWGDVRTSLVHIARAGIHTSSPETRGGKIGALVIVPHPGKLEGSGGVEVQDGFLQDPEACQGLDHWIDIPLHTGGEVGEWSSTSIPASTARRWGTPARHREEASMDPAH